MLNADEKQHAASHSPLTVFGRVLSEAPRSGLALMLALMLAGSLARAAEMANPTLVIVTDRNDLDDQLFDTFAMGRDLLRQEPVQAWARRGLAPPSHPRAAHIARLPKAT